MGVFPEDVVYSRPARGTAPPVQATLRSLPEVVIIVHISFSLLTSRFVISSVTDEKPESRGRNLPKVPELVGGRIPTPTPARVLLPVLLPWAPPAQLGPKCRFPGAAPAHGL